MNFDFHILSATLSFALLLRGLNRISASVGDTGLSMILAIVA